MKNLEVKGIKIKDPLGERIFRVFNAALMLVLIVIFLYPIFYVLMASLSQSKLFFRHSGPLWAPLGFSLQSYKMVFGNPNIGIGYRNTLFIVVIGVVLNMILTIMGGYVLSRRYLMLRKFLTLMVIFTMYFSGGLIPLYMIVRNIGLYDSIWSLIFPVAVNTYNMIIMRTAFIAVPDEMEESAMMDGANQFKLLFRIMVPLVVPTIAVLILYYAVFHWNTWFNAMLFLRNRQLFPLQLVLRNILIENSTNEYTTGVSLDEREFIAETIKYAVMVVAIAPIICLYPLLQRFFIKGVMIGAVKG